MTAFWDFMLGCDDKELRILILGSLNRFRGENKLEIR
jgi:hypothetical protein